MKAIKLTDIRKMELMEVTTPKVERETDILVKMMVVGVCGSDVHYYATGKIGTQVVEYPFAVGHEGAGMVVEVGSAVVNLKAGDRIAVEPALSCGECQQCKAGRPHTCINNRFLGCPGQLEGNLLEYIVLDEKQCIKLGDELTYDAGALSEPLSIGLYANRQANYSGIQDIAILGFGPIGMSVLLTADANLIGKTYVTDKIEDRLAIARKAGVDWTGNPNSEDVVKAISDASPDLVDIVFECCGEQDAMDNALDIVKPGGKIMMIGIPVFDSWSILAEKARRKEVTFINVRRQNNCVEEVMEMMENKSLDPSIMVTHRFPLEKTAKAFELVSQYKDGVMKAMIDF